MCAIMKICGGILYRLILLLALWPVHNADSHDICDGLANVIKGHLLSLRYACLHASFAIPDTCTLSFKSGL